MQNVVVVDAKTRKDYLIQTLIVFIYFSGGQT